MWNIVPVIYQLIFIQMYGKTMKGGNGQAFINDFQFSNVIRKFENYEMRLV